VTTHADQVPGRPYDAVVFDWGGVLTAAPLRQTFESWIASEGVDPEHFADVMRAWLGQRPDRPGEAQGVVPETPIHALERGHLPTAEFEAVLARALADRGSVVEPTGLLDRMLAGLEALEPRMIDLVRELRGGGLRTAVLSNSWGEHYPDDVLAREFDEVVISGRVGMRKPQAEIFHHTARLLGTDVTRLVFVDDLPPNIEAATALGMRAVLHVDAATTVAEVRALVGSGADGRGGPLATSLP
jgi:putative hydrolase of the HAD superfamily